METSRLSASRFSTPMKNIDVEHLEQEKKQIIKKIHYLFVSYTARASRYAYREINEKCFMELINDIWRIQQKSLVKNSQTWKKIVVLYHSKGKKTGMDYQSFLKLLPSLSQLLIPIKNEEQSLKHFLKCLMVVYKQKVAKQIQNRFVQFSSGLKKDTFEYFQKLSQNLYIIFKVYFTEDMTNILTNPDQALNASFERVVLFFKEFEVYPKIITASNLYLLFMEILSNNIHNPFQLSNSQYSKKINKKLQFDFSKFLEILVRVASISVGRLRQLEDPEWWFDRQKECLKTLFEYMESVRIKAKNTRFFNVRFSFICYQEYVDRNQKFMTFTKNGFKFEDEKVDFFQMFEKMKL